MVSVWQRLKIWANHRVVNPFLEYLRQDTDPAVLSRSATLGLILGLCPIIGVSAGICLLACFLFRSSLHAPMALLFNFVAVPIELLLIVPFMRFGELVLRVPPVHVIPKHLSDLTHPGEALKGLGHALVGWLLVSAIIAWPVATLLTPAFAYLKQRFAGQQRGFGNEDPEEQLLEGLNEGGTGSAGSDVEMGAGTPTSPSASLSHPRASILSPRSSAQLGGNRFSPHV